MVERKKGVWKENEPFPAGIGLLVASAALCEAAGFC